MKSPLIPCFRYSDAPTAIEWLCKAFGFTKHLVVPGDNNTIAHAQLVLGDNMIMLGSARDDEFGRYQGTPARTNGINTQSCYLIVPDADSHHARAVAAGARIIMPLVDQSYGGRGYSCLDPEGHAWSSGTYDPWAE